MEKPKLIIALVSGISTTRLAGIISHSLQGKILNIYIHIYIKELLNYTVHWVMDYAVRHFAFISIYSEVEEVLNCKNTHNIMLLETRDELSFFHENGTSTFLNL